MPGYESTSSTLSISRSSVCTIDHFISALARETSEIPAR
jgi:hypothetical protein